MGHFGGFWWVLVGFGVVWWGLVGFGYGGYDQRLFQAILGHFRAIGGGVWCGLVDLGGLWVWWGWS